MTVSKNSDGALSSSGDYSLSQSISSFPNGKCPAGTYLGNRCTKSFPPKCICEHPQKQFKGCPEGTYNTGKCTRRNPPQCECKPEPKQQGSQPCPKGTYNTGRCTKRFPPQCQCKAGTRPTQPTSDEPRKPGWFSNWLRCTRGGCIKPKPGSRPTRPSTDESNTPIKFFGNFLKG